MSNFQMVDTKTSTNFTMLVALIGCFDDYIIKLTSHLIQFNVNSTTCNNVIYHRKKLHHSYLLYFL